MLKIESVWYDLRMAFVILKFVGIIDVGGWEAMSHKYMTSAASYTISNMSYYACGMPRDDSFHIVRSATTGDIPWPGALLGLSTLGLYVWCQDQVSFIHLRIL